MVEVHRFVVDLYAHKFPELDSLIPQPADFVRTVQVMQNEMVSEWCYIVTWYSTRVRDRGKGTFFFSFSGLR